MHVIAILEIMVWHLIRKTGIIFLFYITDPQLIVDFPVHMEFCREITEEDLLQLVMKAHTEYGS